MSMPPLSSFRPAQFGRIQTPATKFGNTLETPAHRDYKTAFQELVADPTGPNADDCRRQISRQPKTWIEQLLKDHYGGQIEIAAQVVKDSVSEQDKVDALVTLGKIHSDLKTDRKAAKGFGPYLENAYNPVIQQAGSAYTEVLTTVTAEVAAKVAQALEQAGYKDTVAYFDAKHEALAKLQEEDALNKHPKSYSIK